MQIELSHFLGILLVAGWLFPLPGALASETNHPNDATTGTLWLQGSEQDSYHAAPTLKTEVSIRVSGLVARAVVRQRFMNPGSTWAEGIYAFPLPEEAAVDQMRIQVGSRVIEGQIMERNAAKHTYEQGKREGRRAGLVEQERPNLFTTSVANIGPGEEILVEIEYQEMLRYQEGRLSLRFPLVVGPRYIPGRPTAVTDRVSGFSGDGWAQDTDQVPDASRITPPVQAPGEPLDNRVSLSVDLQPGFPLAEVVSPYHAVRVDEQGSGQHRVTLVEGPVRADRDFVLAWRPAPGTEPRAALFREDQEGSSYALLMVMPPTRLSAETQALGRELVFVLDVSGSMHGDSILQAKAALKLALRRLGSHDRFNLIWFNDRAGRIFPSSRAVTGKTLAQALQFVDALEANGGTEMLPALRLALDHEHETPNALRQVVFLTDGAVGNEQALFETILERLGKTRLFTVGIGSAPNSYFMRQAARHGRGTFTYIGDVGEVQEKTQALFHMLEHPALTGLHLDLPQTNLAVLPDPIPDLYLGEPVVVLLRGASLPPQVRLIGRLGDTPWHSDVDLAGGSQSPGIAAAWARRKIDGLLDKRLGIRDAITLEAIRDEVLALALEHHLMSPYTSLVAVDVTPVRQGAPLHSAALRTHLPKGWDHGKVFGLASTATPASLHMLVGLFLLALGVVFWRRFTPETV